MMLFKRKACYNTLHHHIPEKQLKMEARPMLFVQENPETSLLVATWTCKAAECVLKRIESFKRIKNASEHNFLSIADPLCCRRVIDNG